MRPLFFLIALASSWVAYSERTLPADVQFSLLFPRNTETYTPTQLFPIVFAVNNLDAVWPLQFNLNLLVLSNSRDRNGSRDLWKSEDFSHSSEVLVTEAARYGNTSAWFVEENTGLVPGKHFFYFPLVNMTNATTDSFTIAWTVTVPHRCLANTTQQNIGGGEDPLYWSNTASDAPAKYREILPRIIEFNTSPGGKRPDIENMVNSCPVSNESNTAAIRVTGIHTEPDGKDCPIIDASNIPFDDCAFKSSAKELAANVSAAMLSQMGCDDGEWQNITAPCLLKKKSMGSLQRSSFGAGWVLFVLVVLSFSVL